MENKLKTNRFFLKDSIRKTIDFRKTEQSLGMPPPEIQKSYSKDKKLLALVEKNIFAETFKCDLLTAINERRSVREFSKTPLNIEELSFLLWATQGIFKQLGPDATLRTIPSAGARHALETYLFLNRIKGIEQGIYRYLPVDNQLVLEFQQSDLPVLINEACFYQNFIGMASAVFFWSTIVRRMEWRYSLAAHKVIAIEAGHACQNLYLACQAIEAGTCAIAAYDQEKIDSLLRLDGNEEFVIYLAPVGKKN